MGSKKNTSIALFLVLNLVFFTLSSACNNCPSPTPNPKPFPPPPGSPGNPGSPGSPGSPGNGTCPRDVLKFGVCADLLGGLINITIGTPPITPCCSLIEGLVDLEAAICLCTAITANVLGINLNIPLSLTLLLNVCSNTVPPGFQCA